MYHHPFKGQFISQSEQEQVIAGRVIPCGYVNATAMCKAGGKRFQNYSRTKQTEVWIAYLSSVTHISVTELMFTIQGGDPGLQGTWVHIDIALDLAQWVSVEMKFWANRVLRLVLEEDFDPNDPEFQNARARAQHHWNSLRRYSKNAFWSLCDTVKAYLESDRASENEVSYLYANCQNAINRGLFGKDAATIRAELGIDKGTLNRDHFNNEALRRLDQIQTLSAKFAAKGQHPRDAIATALTMFDYETIEYSSSDGR